MSIKKDIWLVCKVRERGCSNSGMVLTSGVSLTDGWAFVTEDKVAVARYLEEKDKEGRPIFRILLLTALMEVSKVDTDVKYDN